MLADIWSRSAPHDYSMSTTLLWGSSLFWDLITVGLGIGTS